MLTRAQIGWAKQHDWFYADKGDGTILVLDRYSQSHPDGHTTFHEDTVHHTGSFPALRAWAGY